MIGYSVLSELFTNVLQTKFVIGVYHSIMMKPLPDGGNKPAAPVNGRWEYVGVNDKEGFTCYCRQNGSADVREAERLGGCNNKKYRFQVPHKLVFYHDNETRSHEEIIALILGAVMKTNKVIIQKFTNTPEDLLRSEAPTGRFTFTENTFYLGIDFFVLLDVQTTTCQEEIRCEDLPNPICT
jgi:hypothetical protein